MACGRSRDFCTALNRHIGYELFGKGGSAKMVWGLTFLVDELDG
jgi:hypothetical protein